MLGLGSSLAKGGASLLTFVKDNLKLYLDFKSNKSDTLKFPSEGSTSFDGTDDRIDVSATLSNGTYTVMGWVFKTRQDGAYFIDFRKNSGTGYVAFANNSNNEIYSASGTKYINGVAGTTVPLNTWTHVCVSGITVSSSTTKIGCQNNDTNFFKGSMTNVALWNRELSTEEIQSIMNKSYSQLKGVEKTSLVSWWGLDNTEYMRANISTFMNNDSGWVGTTDLTDGVFTILSHNAYRYHHYHTSSSYAGTNAYYRFEITAKKTSGSPTISVEGIDIFNLTTEYATYTADVLYESTSGNNFISVLNASATDQVLISDFKVLPFGSKDSHGSNNGNNIKMQPPTTSVYGGNAPILPRAVDVAKEGQADAIGNGSLTTSSGGYADLGNDSLIQFGGSFSVSCWFKTTDTTATNEMVIAKADDGISAGWLIRLNSSRKLDFSYVNSASGGVGVTISDTGSAVNDGEWYHVAFVHESGVGNRAYKNGILIGSNSTGTDLGSHTPNLHVGSQDYSSARPLDGSFAQVGLWQGALTQAQIQSVMESTSYSKIPADVKSTLGTDLFTDSTFDLSGTQSASTTGTHWTTGNSWTIANGEAIYDGINNESPLSLPSSTFKDAGIYKFSFTVSDASSHARIKIKADANDIIASANYSNGDHTIYYNQANAYGSFKTLKIEGRNDASGSSFKLQSASWKLVTNDIVAYYPLDGSSSANGVTQDVTTGEVLGADELPSPDLTSGTGLTITQGTTGTLTHDTTAGTITATNDVQDGYLRWYSAGLEENKLYKLEIVVDSYTGGRFRTTLGWNGTNFYPSVGTNIQYFIGSSTASFGIRIDDGNPAEFVISKISVKEVTSNTGVLK